LFKPRVDLRAVAADLVGVLKRRCHSALNRARSLEADKAIWENIVKLAKAVCERKEGLFAMHSRDNPNDRHVLCVADALAGTISAQS
jgi:hypothetical protein